VEGPTGTSGLSPDALLEYCQSQLGPLDTEIKHSIDHQNLELLERQAAEKAQGVLEQFGDQGPQNVGDMQKCVDALNRAASSLPPGDPVAAELTDFKNNMISQYGFTEAKAGQPLTDAEQQKLAYDESLLKGMFSGQLEGEVRDLNKKKDGWSAYLCDSMKPHDNEWKGTCDALGNIVGNIKSNAEIEMLSLQDLVSQRQQAVSLACNMMNKEDTSLEQLARLGQG
jgi:hypothetical protein